MKIWGKEDVSKRSSKKYTTVTIAIHCPSQFLQDAESQADSCTPCPSLLFLADFIKIGA